MSDKIKEENNTIDRESWVLAEAEYSDSCNHQKDGNPEKIPCLMCLKCMTCVKTPLHYCDKNS